jgi:hypothetical protein
MSKYDQLVQQASKKYGVPLGIARKLVMAESSGNPNAVSPKGAQGLMQLMPGTAKELGVTDPFDPSQNIDAGTRYLKQQYDRFGNWEQALSAYNAGPNRVAKGGKLPSETQAYTKKILGGGSMAAPKKSLGEYDGFSIDPSLDPEVSLPKQEKKKFGLQDGLAIGSGALGAIAALLQKEPKDRSFNPLSSGGGGSAPILGGQSYNSTSLQKQYGMNVNPYQLAVASLLRG